MHPVKDNSFADARRGTRQQRGYDAEWERARQVAIERDQGLCQPCLRSEPSRVTRFRDVDHVVPKAQAQRLGWTRDEMDAPANLQCICGPCHKAKTAREAHGSESGGGGS